VAILAIVALLAAVGLGVWMSRRAGAQPTTQSLLAGEAANPLSDEAPPNFMKLKGRWVRPDGGYVIEVKGVDDRGGMDAAYFNPRSIHVAQAKALRDGSGTRVFIELRDVNYPGSTYNLTYEPLSDRLEGIYYQAALQQSYEVIFVRAQ
jgi:hypothetical protein